MEPPPTTRSEALAKRYEALLQVLRSLASRTPDDLASVLADELRLVLDFDFLAAVVYREDTCAVEWRVANFSLSGSAPSENPPTAAWWIYQNQQSLCIDDWSRDERYPEIREALKAVGPDPRSFLGVPLASPHRPLGAFAIATSRPHAYSEDDVRFMSSVADGLAMAIDDSLNLARSRRAQSELEQQNARLKLLLNVTNQITSNLELRDLLRAISTNIRGVMRCDMVAITLPEGPSEGQRLLALDFPDGKGLIREGLLLTPVGPGRKALETLEPTLGTGLEPDAFAPEVRELAIAEGLRRNCVIPLANRGRALGALAIARTSDVSFTPEDLEFLTQVSGQIAIAVENALAYREISELKDKLAQEKVYLEEEIRSEMSFENIVGNSPALKHVLELVETVASSDSTVLLLGDTGTGKELIARAIHERSRRKDRTFVKLNCAAIPTGLLESELFGHEKGAFTGAIAQKLGRMELADQGTLFLDEVGDIPVEIQPKLLRALQEREFERLGSNHTRKANVRLVAATNRDLEKMIATREFRSDLYYRLNVFPIRIPPLRERREDIPLLVSYFVQKYSRQMKKDIDSVPTTALKTLSSWNWPGNIRELENFIERAVILTRGKALDAPLSELREPYVTPAAVDSRDSSGHDDVVRIVREAIEGLNKTTPKSDRPHFPKRDREEEKESWRSEIMHVLHETRGRVGGADGAAARMGINRTTLLSRMKRLGIHANEFE